MAANREVFLFLRKAGCCMYCSLRFMRVRSPDSFLNIQDFVAERKLNDEDAVLEPQPKVQKANPCVVCLGLLQYCTDDQIVEKIATRVGGYDSDKFTVALSLPVSLHLRAHSLWLYLKEEFSQEPVTLCDEVNVTALKDVWKWIITPRLAKLINKESDSGFSCDFIINVPITYEDEKEECMPLHQLSQNGRTSKQKGNGPTRKGTELILKDIDDALFKKKFQFPPSVPMHSASVDTDRVVCLHNSIYVAGRYLKFSRSLSQTPWLIDGERKMKESVEELIAPFVKKAVIASSYKFSSSGREDVDVRTLGRGRPFVLDLLNAHKIKLTSQEVRRLEETINLSTNDIAVRDLQIVPKDQLVELKQGEEEKTKQYMALCISHDPVTQHALDRLSSISDLKIMQKMPIRVLHRRPAACRPRLVHSMKAWLISSDPEQGPDDAQVGLFKLEVVTQAGTYIKEFVHGDFGRTKPSLGELLGNVNVDILALDVMAVSLDWPPAVNYDI